MLRKWGHQVCDEDYGAQGQACCGSGFEYEPHSRSAPSGSVIVTSTHILKEEFWVRHGSSRWRLASWLWDPKQSSQGQKNEKAAMAIISPVKDRILWIEIDWHELAVLSVCNMNSSPQEVATKYEGGLWWTWLAWAHDAHVTWQQQEWHSTVL